MSPLVHRHGRCQAILCGELRTQGELPGLGIAYGMVSVIIRGEPDRVVDIVGGFACTASLPLPRSPEGLLERAPDVVFEIRSSNEDQTPSDRKVADRFSAGARAVVLIDFPSEAVIVYRRDAAPQTLRQQDTLILEDNMPGFRLSVADLFAWCG